MLRNSLFFVCLQSLRGRGVKRDEAPRGDPRMNLGDYYILHVFWLSIGMPLHDWLVSVGIPGWIVSLIYVAIGAATILGMITVFVIIAIWAERRFIARLQDRLGP